MHNPEDRSFIGHPRGLAYIAFTEAWERFSYYGMQALLVLYMVNRLLHPEHIEHIAGFGPFRHFLESVYGGPLSVQALASAIFGLYTGLVYLTPIGGGLIADAILGRTRTITIGALLMSAGHFLMAFDLTFLIALTCLLLGVGCFKGNLASQVGALYSAGDNRRADAFQIYYIFINGGVIAAPLIAGTLGEKVGWHWGFGAAGVGMLIGLTIYLLGRKYLPPDSPVVEKKGGSAKAKLSSRDIMAIAALLVLLPFLTIAIIPNQQIFNAYLVWAEQNVNFPVVWGKNANDMVDHARFDRVGQFSFHRRHILAAVVEKISGTDRDYKDRHRQLDRGDRNAFARDRIGHRRSRRKSVHRVAHRVPCLEQRRICKRLSGFARTLCASRAGCLVRHHHRHLLSGLLCRQQSRRLDRRFSRKNARDTILAFARRIGRNGRLHFPSRGPGIRTSPRAGGQPKQQPFCRLTSCSQVSLLWRLRNFPSAKS